MLLVLVLVLVLVCVLLLLMLTGWKATVVALVGVLHWIAKHWVHLVGGVVPLILVGLLVAHAVLVLGLVLLLLRVVLLLWVVWWELVRVGLVGVLSLAAYISVVLHSVLPLIWSIFAVSMVSMLVLVY